MAQIQFFNPYAPIRETGNRLPHWQQQGALYFVTFRLADAIPDNLQAKWRAEREIWLRFHPEPWSLQTEHEYHERFSNTIERWLDAGHSSCLLRRESCAAIVDETLRHFDGERISLISSVVMPNHMHVLFGLSSEFSLEKLVRSWKTFAARRINELCDRSGNLWQRDSFDRLVRDAQHLANCVRNPGKATLSAGEYLLYESDLARGIE